MSLLRRIEENPCPAAVLDIGFFDFMNSLICRANLVVRTTRIAPTKPGDKYRTEEAANLAYRVFGRLPVAQKIGCKSYISVFYKNRSRGPGIRPGLINIIRNKSPKHNNNRIVSGFFGNVGKSAYSFQNITSGLYGNRVVEHLQNRIRILADYIAESNRCFGKFCIFEVLEIIDKKRFRNRGRFYNLRKQFIFVAENKIGLNTKSNKQNNYQKPQKLFDMLSYFTTK